jgi:hypothetical protein
MSFKNLPNKIIHETGIQYLVFYPNGYGASIVQHQHSYGSDRGLWELAVIKGDDKEWDICYSTPITPDVKGWLTESEVDELLTNIEAL